MKSVLYTLLALALTVILPQAAHATHNRAGEIHVRQIGTLTVEATIITWTKASSTNADRDTLTICWGDGTCETVWRANGGGEGQVLPNDIKYNIYVATHTYAGRATYKISMTDPNRIVGIINVNPPASENIPFHIETTYTFLDAGFKGTNTTPYLLQPPIDNACVGKPFKHNPNAYDPDGDSLSYQLIVPLQALSSPVPNYSYPSQHPPGPNNFFQINSVTGDVLWLTPQQPGEYNVAFIIVSWRKGQPIDTTIRDMQIFVDVCDNNPPDVQTADKYCVVAGTQLSFTVTATDPDSGNLVRLTALGGPFSTPYSPATFTAPAGWAVPPVLATFKWNTTCEHISNQTYTVVFKANDTTGVNNVPSLSDLQTVSIKVVGPPPEGVQASAQLGAVEITWDKPYSCEDAEEEYFYGFSVWRREGSNPFPIDTCMPGLAGKGYTELTFITREELNGRYYFKDTNVERGRTYCYRVLAKFAKRTALGYVYNLVESLPSEEVCVQLPRDLPLITNVSVLDTDPANGRMEIRWSKPVAPDLDTVLNHGPYRYQVLRAPDFSGGTLEEVPGASFVAQNFWQANDTVFIDNGLNTAGQPYRYRIAFYVRGEDTPLGYTNIASSPFLSIASSDNTNTLSWRADVPWNNYEYAIYRLNNNTGVFDSIGRSAVPSYADTKLQNGAEYCYYVRTQGTYSIGGVADPLFNLSQRNCGTPIDTMPPCAPALEVDNLCTTGEATLPDPPYENFLNWTNPNLSCPNTDDVVRYHLWYAPGPDEPLALLETFEGAGSTAYTHLLDLGLAGCYAVSAVDSFSNESTRSAVLCVDNCPEYVLPNAFTPNEDGANDRFRPFPGWRFVERVDMQIFNRWGNLVFSTTDPDINWDGRNESGQELAEGTYFYVCQVYEQRVEGVVRRPEVLSGYIELIRGGR
ncbi:MAG: gliding motility-associated C-terminal domain-containing protein [Saprospiraceae bacterium]|nr:gliding motility-associated C-terminal domain-containing protein [Saprospiraceae bacterium]